LVDTFEAVVVALVAEEETTLELDKEWEAIEAAAVLLESVSASKCCSGKRTVRHRSERRHSPRAFTPAAFPAAVSL